MTVVRSDTFVRANQTGWGTASDGNTWTIQSGNGQSIASNEGHLSGSTASTFATLGAALSGADAEGLVRFDVGDNTHNTAGIILRWTDANNHWLCRFNGAASGGPAFNVMVKASGTYTSLTPTYVLTPALATFFWIRFRCQGTTISFRVWQDGSAEPGTWTEQYTNSSQNVAGAVGLYGFSSSTSGVNFDTFSVDDLVTNQSFAGTLTPTDTLSGVLAGQPVSLTGTLTPTDTAAGQLTNGTGIGDLSVTTKSQSWSGGPTGSPGTETDVTYQDSTQSGWTVGIIPSYGGATVSSIYEKDGGVTGANQTALNTSFPDGHLHWLEQSTGAVFAGSEDKPFILSEQAPVGTPFRRYYVGTFGPDANGFNWSVSSCIYPGDPGFIAYRFDCTNPNGTAIALASTDSLEIALLGGLQQSDTTWAPANGGYGKLSGSDNVGWPSTLTNFDPDYVYIVPAAGAATQVGQATIKRTPVTSLSPAWALPQLQYLQNTSRLKIKVQGVQTSFPANTTSTVYLLNVLRRSLTATDVRAMAADYLNPGTPSGPFLSFSYDERAFVFDGTGASVTTTLDLTAASLRYKPVLKLTNWNTASTPILTWGGTTLTLGTDYRSYYDAGTGTLYLQLYFDIVPAAALPSTGQLANAALAITSTVIPLTGTLTPSDTTAATLTPPAAALSGTLTATDTAAATLSPPAATLSGTLTPSDTLAGLLAPAVLLTGTLTPADTMAGTLTPPAAALSGTPTPTDTAAATLTIPPAPLSGTLTPSDTLAGALTPAAVALSGSLTASDTAAATLTPPAVALTGTFTPSDTLAGALVSGTLALTGTLTPSDTLAGALTPAAVALGGALTPSDTLAGALTPAAVALAGTFPPTDTAAAVLVVSAIPLSGTLTPSDTAAATLSAPTATLIGALTPSDTLSGALTPPAATLAGTLAESDTAAAVLTPPTATLAGTLAESDTLAGALTPPAVTLSGALTPTDTLAGSLIGLVAFAGVIAASDTLAGQLTIGLFGTLTPTDTLAGALTPPAVALGGAIKPSDTLSGGLAAFLLFVGTLTPSDTLAGVLSAGTRLNNEAVTTDSVLLALSVILPAGTQQAIASGTVTINDESPLALETVAWPALLIMEGAQETMRINARTWQKKLTIYVFYLAEWTETPETNDQIWAEVNADMERMIANLTDNPTLTCVLPGAGGPTRNCLELVTLEPSPRTQKVVDDRTYGRGTSVVQRMLTIKVNLPPYVTVG